MDINQIKLLVIGLMLLGSITFFVFGINILFRKRKLKKYGIKTNATIVAVSLRGRPTVEYQTEQGLLKVKSLFGSPTFFQKGNVVQVFYDKEKPERFCIEGDIAPIFLGLICLFIGMAAIGMSVIAYLFIK
jgi:hypothetical protein